MADDQFNVGDVVQLKSGGPKMTVVETGRGKAKCSYFDTKGSLEYATFNNETLNKFD